MILNLFFFFNDTATPELYPYCHTLSLHAALPIFWSDFMSRIVLSSNRVGDLSKGTQSGGLAVAVGDVLREGNGVWFGWSGDIVANDTEIDRKSTRLNSSH